jgi:hypothetical protein
VRYDIYIYIYIYIYVCVCVCVCVCVIRRLKVKGSLLFSLKGAIHSQLNREILLCNVIPDGKTE